MGMFDWFKPVPPLINPMTGEPIPDDWQSKDGSCSLLSWTQGIAVPEWAVDEELKTAEVSAWLLQRSIPEKFQIYQSYTVGPDEYICVAECSCTDGIWSETRLMTCGTYDRHGHFKNYKKEG